MMILTANAWHSISEALSNIAIFAAMPTLVVWICLKVRNQKFNKVIDLAQFALEKDPSLNLDDFMAKLSPAKRTYAQKSVTLILISCILILLGLAAATIAWVFNSKGQNGPYAFFGIVACVLLAVGISFLISFFYTKKLVRKGLLK